MVYKMWCVRGQACCWTRGALWGQADECFAVTGAQEVVEGTAPANERAVRARDDEGGAWSPMHDGGRDWSSGGVHGLEGKRETRCWVFEEAWGGAVGGRRRAEEGGQWAPATAAR